MTSDIVLRTLFDTIHLVATSINKHVHFLPRDARSAKRGFWIAIVSRPSVCLSVRNVDVRWAKWAYRLD